MAAKAGHRPSVQIPWLGDRVCECEPLDEALTEHLGLRQREGRWPLPKGAFVWEGECGDCI